MALTLLKIKTFLKIAFLWSKKNIHVILIVAVLSMVIIKSIIDKKNSEKEIKELRDLLKKSQEDYNKSRELHRNEIKRREELENAYKLKIKEIETQYQVRLNNISKQQEERVKEILEQNNTPQEMEEKLTSVLGIQRG